ncbi:uncharacterized protein F4822DRAFT_415111 [Hypoxylon trugodes]|uniref:uncharacterized protein n=1 Tax=Hypoxylon trugodes TaxID=326681 RepID=UPI00219C4E33|nr:uncharacterized protein F4822DRAFT_415111 [Hypoxylon trugodes]KAI1384418.1 hypothetical protein F4822DRAFT_415111 [Hypoxylon trugodes]
MCRFLVEVGGASPRIGNGQASLLDPVLSTSGGFLKNSPPWVEDKEKGQKVLATLCSLAGIEG